jgi:transcriptional regulator with XRE-family HTH domain
MKRRKSPKGTWMKLRSAEILRAFMNQKDFSMQRLATYSGCSKSFVGFLANGTKTSCTKQLAEQIARALDVPIEVLFEAKASAGSGNNDKRRAKVA